MMKCKGRCELNKLKLLFALKSSLTHSEYLYVKQAIDLKEKCDSAKSRKELLDIFDA